MVMQTVEVQTPGARQTIGRARLSSSGLDVWFGDGLRAHVPLTELREQAGGLPHGVTLPENTHSVVLHMAKGREHPIPWDMLRFRADAGFRAEMHAEVVKTNQYVATRIRAARESLNVTQTALALAAGVSRATLSRIELGQQEASVPTLFAVAKALDLNIGDLLGG